MSNPGAAQRPYAFVQASDNHLWVNWWNGSQWQWADQGTPPGKTVATGAGAITVMDNPNAEQRPYAFVRANDNRLWVNWWSSGPYVRRGVWDLEPTTAFSSDVMRQYAIAVWTMRKRAPQSPTSWSYQANIHFTFTPQNQWPAGAPWNQCPHGSLFFFPWHRMYITRFEQIVNAIAQEHGATGRWALPYWDWTNHPTMPLAFRQAQLPAGFTMPDGSTANPLFVPVPNRSGLGINNANPLPPSAVSLACFSDVSFSQFDNDYEETPHGDVHVLVGGRNDPSSCNIAWMTNVPCAVQDPIFWLHHGNVDRCWDGWLKQGGGRSNPTSSAWLDKQYTLFTPNGAPTQMRVRDVLDSARQLSYVYDAYPTATGAPSMPVAPPVELVSVNDEPWVAQTTEPVSLTGPTTAVAKVTKEPAAAAPRDALAESRVPGRVTLDVDGIDLEAHPGVIYEIYMNLPEGQDPDHRSPYYVGNLSLFGVMPAKAQHAGHEHSSSRHYDVTDQYRILKQRGEWPSDDIRLAFIPRGLEGPPEDEAAPSPESTVALPAIRIERVTIQRH
jgi:tyrosinase